MSVTIREQRIGGTNLCLISNNVQPVAGSPLTCSARGRRLKLLANQESVSISEPDDHLFAVRYDVVDTNSSRRPRQTLRAISHAFGLPINDTFGKELGSKLVAAIDKLQGTVRACTLGTAMRRARLDP